MPWRSLFFPWTTSVSEKHWKGSIFRWRTIRFYHQPSSDKRPQCQQGERGDGSGVLWSVRFPRSSSIFTVRHEHQAPASSEESSGDSRCLCRGGASGDLIDPVRNLYREYDSLEKKLKEYPIFPKRPEPKRWIFWPSRWARSRKPP